MSNDLNQVILLGRLGKDPEVFAVGSKPPFAKVQLATNEKWKKDGETFSKVTWHTVLFHRKLAELCGKYLHKGDRVMVIGDLATQKWQDKDGNKRFSVVVQAKELKFLTPRPAQEKEPDDVVANDETIVDEDDYC